MASTAKTPRWVVHEDGTKYSMIGKATIHRVGGPAIIYTSGLLEWWQNDLLHRDDGPAVEYPDGQCEWWLNGYIHYDFSDWVGSLDVSEHQKTILRLKYSHK